MNENGSTLESASCEVCGIRPARMRVLRRRGGDTFAVMACPECASERARLYAGANVSIGGVLSSLASGVGPKNVPNFECTICGNTLADVVVDGRPGCASCYIKFASELEQALFAAQGSVRHLGKKPRRL